MESAAPCLPSSSVSRRGEGGRCGRRSAGPLSRSGTCPPSTTLLTVLCLWLSSRIALCSVACSRSSVASTARTGIAPEQRRLPYSMRHTKFQLQQTAADEQVELCWRLRISWKRRLGRESVARHLQIPVVVICFSTWRVVPSFLTHVSQTDEKTHKCQGNVLGLLVSSVLDTS